MVSSNVRTTNGKLQDLIIPLRSCMAAECGKAAAVSQGIREEFSTGSHDQYPSIPAPHTPTSCVRMPKERKTHENRTPPSVCPAWLIPR